MNVVYLFRFRIQAKDSFSACCSKINPELGIAIQNLSTDKIEFDISRVAGRITIFPISCISKRSTRPKSMLIVWICSAGAHNRGENDSLLAGASKWVGKIVSRIC